MMTGSIDPISGKQAFMTVSQKNGSKQVQVENQTDALQDNHIYRDDKIEEKLEKRVEETVKDMNDIVEKVREGLKFKLHDKTDRLMVQVINTKTMEIIKELPPEEVLDLSARIQEMVGILIDEKV